MTTATEYKEMFFAEAIRTAIAEEMHKDDSIFLIGEDIGLYGGAFGVTQGLLKDFSSRRVVDAPISENSFVGLAIGSSLTGLRPVVEIMYMDFILLALDQIVNKAAKLQFIHQDKLKLPLVIRTAAGAGRHYGPDHSQTFESLLMHIPGLKVVYPSTPSDAYLLMKEAINLDSPVIFIEHKFLYGKRGRVQLSRENPAIFGKGKVLKEGDQLTVVSYGRMAQSCLEAIEGLKTKSDSIELIDLRTLKPLDKELILRSVSKTKKLLVVEEGNQACGVGAEIISLAAENLPASSGLLVKRLSAAENPIPFSPYLEDSCFPGVEQIRVMIEEMTES